MLTGDLNVGVVEWTTQYRVADPYLYMFKVREVTATFRDMNEAVMRTVVGDRSVSEVLTVGRQGIASEVEVRLQELCDQYETGIHVEQIVLQDVTPAGGGACLVQRGQPGPAGARADDQRGALGVQPCGAAGAW